MQPTISGIHHVTAIADDPQRNLDFYSGVLGLRLVKLTVNFDDPGSYHAYYGAGVGTPGSIISFFFWPGAPRGRQGSGQAAVTSLAIPQQALGYWVARLIRYGVTFDGPTRRFGEQVLSFRDPDGLLLELVGRADAAQRPVWEQGPVPAEQAVHGINGVTLWQENPEAMARLLEQLGFKQLGQEGLLTRYQLEAGLPSTQIDLRATPGFWRGSSGPGTVHHVALRTPDTEQQIDLQVELMRLGLHVSPVLDRSYFRSIYFREPGGTLFEVATDGPGFTVDEPEQELGSRLQLPDWLEPQRRTIEAGLPVLYLPSRGAQLDSAPA